MTSPGGGRGGINLTALWVPILPETSQIATGVEKAGKEAKGKFDQATRGIGTEMARGVHQAAQQSSASLETVTRAYQRLESAKIKSISTSNAVNKAERDLLTARTAGKANADQLATMEERLSLAKARHESTTRVLTNATQAYSREQQNLSTHMAGVNAASQQMSSGANMSLSSIATKAGVVGGAVGVALTAGLHVAELGFEKLAEVGKSAFEHILQIGEGWHNLENQIKLHSTASGEELERLNRIASNIARSGAVVNFETLGGTLATLNARIKDIDDASLQKVATHIEWLGRKLGEPVDMTSFTAIINQFKIAPEQADETLGVLLHVAQETGVSLNTIIAGMKGAAPVAREFHLDLGKTAGILSTFNQAGLEPTKAIAALKKAAAAYAADGRPLNTHLAETITKLQGMSELDPERLNIANKVFGKRGGVDILSVINQIDPQNLLALGDGAKTSAVDIDALTAATWTLQGRIDSMKTRLAEALRPVGLGLVDAMGGGLNRAADWITTHGSTIIGWLKTAGDYAIGFVHTFAEMGSGILRAVGYIMPVTSFFFKTFLAGFSQITGLVGKFLSAIGLDGMGKALQSLSEGSKGVFNMMDKLPDVLGHAADGLDKLAGVTDTKATTAFDGFMDSTQRSILFTQAFGKAILSMPDEHTVTIKNNTPEVTAKLHDLGIDIETLPDGTVNITAKDEAAKKTFEAWAKQTTGKDIPVKLKPEAQNDMGGKWEAPTDMQRLFGLDKGPIDVPLTPSLAPGGALSPGMPFTLPPGSAAPPGFPTAPAPPRAAGPPPAPPPGIAPPTIVGAAPGTPLGDLPGILGGGGVPGRGGAPRGFMPHTGGSGGAEAWRPTVRSILAQYGPRYGITNPKAWEDAMVRQIATESGGDWTSINLTDSNAVAGHPSQGIGQFTPGTYDANNITGLPFQNPYGQIAAMIAYVFSSKGGVNPDGSPKGIGLGTGYQEGGVAHVPGTDRTVIDFDAMTPAQLAAYKLGMYSHNNIPWIKPLGEQHGGGVDGLWTPGRDSVPAALEPGEWVTQRSRTQHMLPFLKWSNNAPVGALQDMMGLMGFGQGGDVGGVSQVIWSDLEDPSVQAAHGDAGVGVLHGQIASGGPGSPYSDETNPGGQGFAGHHGHVHTTFNRDPFTGQPYNQVAAGTNTQLGEWSAFPPWVKQLGDMYGLDAKTYAGHQEWDGANHGIDWYPRGKADMSGASYTHQDNAMLSSFANAAMSVGTGQGSFGAGGGGLLPPAGGGGSGGFTPSQYPGYYVDSSGKYVTADQVPGKGNYGGATQSEIDSASKARESAASAQQDADQAVIDARKALDKLQHPTPDDATGVIPTVTPEQIDAATRSLDKALKSQKDAADGVTKANTDYSNVLNKPPEPGTKGAAGKGGKTDQGASDLGGGLVKGALQALGFDGSVFEDPTQWGIWKLFTGGVNYAGGLLKNAGTSPTGLFAPPGSAEANPFNVFAQGGGGGGGDMLGGLLGGLTNSVGITLPAADAATVTTAPGMPGAVSAPGTVQPGSGIPGPMFGGTNFGPPPGPGGATVDASTNVTVNGPTSDTALASMVTGAQTRGSRNLTVGAPNGGLRMV